MEIRELADGPLRGMPPHGNQVEERPWPGVPRSGRRIDAEFGIDRPDQIGAQRYRYGAWDDDEPVPLERLSIHRHSAIVAEMRPDFHPHVAMLLPSRLQPVSATVPTTSRYRSRRTP